MYKIIKKMFMFMLLLNIFIFNSTFATDITIDFETTGGYTVTTTVTGTDTDWIRSTNSPYEGSYSLESTTGLNDNDVGCFEITNNVAETARVLSFYYKVSSEANYDFLVFYLDGVQQNQWSGNVGWTKQSYNLNVGNHTFRWCYEKDGSVSNGTDQAWVDLVDVSIDPNLISSPVFHFDGFDIDGDGNINNNPAEGASVTTWIDKFNGYNATQATTPPIYSSNSIKTHSGVVFDGTTYLDIANQTAINTSTYTAKSFAMVFKTGNDITSMQTVYEQGGGVRGYSIQIENGILYAGVWNNSERISPDQYKTLSGTIKANTEYRIIMVQDSSDTIISNNTFEVFVNGISLGVLNNIDYQRSHAGGIQLGRSNGSIRLSTNASLGTGFNFMGNIGEFYSWNYTLTNNESLSIDQYLYDKWIYTPPTPGGVNSGLQIWLKANIGTSTTTDGNSLTSWADQSGNGFDAGLGVSPTYYNTTFDLNYNPIIDFNGTDQYLENLNNGAYTHSYFAVVIPDQQVDGTLTGQVPFGFDCNSGVLNTGTCGLTFAGVVLGAFTVAINDEVITHAIGSSTRRRSAQIGTASYSATKPMLININENSSGTGTEISEKGVLIDNYSANTYQNLSTADYNIGRSPDTNYPFYYDGKIAEIINYNSRITPIDKQKIESYLSLKYGMTLNSGTQNYIASDGTTNIYNTTIAGTYVNDIFGIGRDDSSELGQIKSKSINDDNVITVEAIGEGTNTSPSFIDMNDLEFLSISNNGLGNTWSATDSPTGYFILDRLWKTQEIGEVGTLNIDVNVANTFFDIPNLSVGTNYYFIYDSDNDGSLADETPIAMTNTSGDIWRISLNINNNTIFTFASEASTNNIPTDILLSNNIINENVSEGTNIGTLSTTDADSGDIHTYSFVAGAGDTDNSYFSITGNTLSINISPDYEIKQNFSVRIQTDDGNGGQFQKSFIIYINDIGETIVSLIDFEQSINSYKYSLTSGNWSRTTTNPNEGSYSYESNNGGLNNTQSCFEINHTFSSTGTLDFDYTVSSQANSDYLRFYIDNIEQQAWSGTVPWAIYTDNTITSGTHTYKWCYIKDGSNSSGTDNSFIDYIVFTNGSVDTTPPTINSINYSSGTLLPGGNHNIIITYSDSESGVDTSSDTISLNKWDGSVWGSDISATGFNLGSKTITSTVATYPTNNLVFGKYRYEFGISDNSSNISSTGAVFYIDEPELIISTGALDIGSLEDGITKFSTGITVTVKTVGAGFDVILNQSGTLLNGTIEIIDWNGSEGVGYDQDPYTSTISIINTNEIIATQAGSINTDGNKNTYTYSIKMGALIGEEQTAGNYSSSISFGIDLDY